MSESTRNGNKGDKRGGPIPCRSSLAWYSLHSSTDKPCTGGGQSKEQWISAFRIALGVEAVLKRKSPCACCMQSYRRQNKLQRNIALRSMRRSRQEHPGTLITRMQPTWTPSSRNAPCDAFRRSNLCCFQEDTASADLSSAGISPVLRDNRARGVNLLQQQQRLAQSAQT